MKILIVGPNSIHVSSYITSLVQFEKELYLLSEEKCAFEGIKQEFKVNFRNLNPISIFKNYTILKKILREIKPDVIHIHQINRLAFFVSKASKLLKIPVVSTAWGSDVLIMPFKNSFYKYLVSTTLANSFVTTADSLDMLEKMKSISSENIGTELLQYGIDIVNCVEKENIIYSNRLHRPLYRIDQIINYFSEFNNTNPDWKLIIAGTGDQTKELQEQVIRLNLEQKVSFVGWLNKAENHHWYAKSKVYISIPESDGTSVSLLEAMSAGCIPIVSDLPVSKEWIEQGKNGIIEEPGQNPFNKLNDLQIEELTEFNLKLIHQKAARSKSTQRFLELYKLAENHGN